MSKNPKVTIALAFVLTFLLGTGAGYLLCGTMHSQTGMPSLAEEELSGLEQITPVPAPQETASETPETEEPVAPVRERRGTGGGERAGEVDGDGLAPGEGPGRGQGYRMEAGLPDSDTSAETIGVEPESVEQARVRQRMDADEQPEDRPARRYRSQEQVAQDTQDMQDSQDTIEVYEAEQANRRTVWRSRTDDQRQTSLSRYRLRLIRDLDLTEEEAEEFFSALETHRRQMREEVIIPQRELRQRQTELSEQLERDLSEILSEEQMETWKERYAPRMDRSSRDDTDRRSRWDRSGFRESERDESEPDDE